MRRPHSLGWIVPSLLNRATCAVSLASLLAGACGSVSNGSAGTAGAGGDGAGTAGSSGTTGAAGTTGVAGTTGTAGTTGAAGAGRGGGAGTGPGTAGAAGTGTAGTGGTAACSATPPDPSDLIGWASVSGSGVTTTTGGGNATPQVVTTVGALKTAAAGTAPAVIYVMGVLASDKITIGGNKTIVGLCGAEIHGHLDISSSNVIVRNIKIVGYGVGNCALDPDYDSTVGCSSGNDAITVTKGHHIWFDHDDISDGSDGNLDITLGADLVTVSWTKFHYTARTDTMGNDSTGAAGHRYSNLVGGSDNSSADVGKLNVTWHHNWWADKVVERQPRIRYGKNHLFNNLWTSSGDNYCVRAGMDAEILIESSAFVGVKTPQEFNSTADQGTAFITVMNNLYSGTSGTQATGGGGTAFTTPSYAYTPDAASAVQAAVQAGAGPH